MKSLKVKKRRQHEMDIGEGPTEVMCCTQT